MSARDEKGLLEALDAHRPSNRTYTGGWWELACTGCDFAKGRRLSHLDWAPHHEHRSEVFHDALIAAGFGEVVPPIVQWAVLHENGDVWNYYHSREAAEAFVADMREVDVDMVAASRDHYPAMYGEWEPVK